jgi:hypothetical protein
MRVLVGPATAMLMALMGCVSHTSLPPAPSPAASIHLDRSSPTPPSFEYERSEIAFKNRMLDDEESSLYRVRYIRFPSYGENGQQDNLVSGKYYESKTPGRKPLVIIVPIPDSHAYPAAKMTAYLKTHSQGEINVFDMLIERDIVEWQGMASAPDEATFMRRLEKSAKREWTTVIDIRRVIDWASATGGSSRLEWRCRSLDWPRRCW